MESVAHGEGLGRSADQYEQSTRLTLDLEGRFHEYPCTIEAVIGDAGEVVFSGTVNLSPSARLGDFVKKTLSLPAEDIPFPDFSLRSLELKYSGRGAMLLRLSDLEVDLPSGAPIEKIYLDFAVGRRPAEKDAVGTPAAVVAGVRAFTGERIRFAALVNSSLVDNLLGDFGVSHLGLYYASENVSDGLALFDNDDPRRAFAKGVSFSARFGTTQSYTDIALPPPPEGTGDGGQATPAAGVPLAPQPVAETSGDDKRLRKWFPVQKSFGPLEVRRIGGEWHEGKLGFLIDAGVELLGLKVALAGLRVSVKPANLTDLALEDLEFGLDGLEIGFQGGPVSISGAFLRTSDGAYSGRALIRAEMFTIAAIGSYATTAKGDPSLFIFGAYVGIIGGPPCFVVQGIAAGFGYNRGLSVPDVEKVRDFPLVSLVLSPAPSGSQNVLEQLRGDHFPIMPGQYWLAAGIKFTSFKLIDAFALLTVQFGARFELALLGIATMQQPPKVDGAPAPKPFVYVELALSVRFAPDDGLLAARAVLTSNSYLFDTRCRLTGGFAFCIWFPPTNPAFQNHSGDFVLTFGGYHPRFKVPAHYPQVPRIGFNWQLPDQGVMVKGECYFALTPSCIMGGCRLLATYHSDDLTVWFEAHADFLMAWEPFHYEADIGIWIGASYTLRVGDITSTISFQLGASLSIWGPEFAGEAHIDLGVAAFTVPIGAANQPRMPTPLDWPEFEGKFIPQIDKTPAPLGIAITGGVLRDDREQDLVIVNPYEFRMLVDAYIPVTDLSINEERIGQDSDEVVTVFGIRPMDVRSIGSALAVSVLGPDGKTPIPMCAHPLTKGVPEALWSPFPAPDPSGKQPIEAKVIANALSGTKLSVPKGRAPEEVTTSPRITVVAKQTAQPDLEQPKHAQPVGREDAQTRLGKALIEDARVRSSTVHALQALGFDLSAGAIDLEEMARCVVQPDVLLAPPAFVALGELPPQRLVQ